ncbi:EXTL2, alpha-1,4-N-acetylhexosaminyltransferase, partial [Ancylostoma duodenale]
SPPNSSTKLPDSGRNTVIVNFGEPFRIEDSFAIMVQQSDRHLAKPIDFNVFLDVPEYDASAWKSLPNLLPYSRKFLLFVFIASKAEEIAPFLSNDLSRLNTSAVLSDHIDWRLASIRFHPARFPELHFVIRSLEMAEVLELRRMGRFFFERYLGDQRAVVRALLASLRERLGIPSPAEAVAKAVPLFNNSFTAPILTPINVPPLDDEYLGPLEGAVDSASYLHNFSTFNMYSYHSWNIIGQPGTSVEFLAQSVDPPTESEFYPDSNIGFRPIEPGSGVEFSKALGGNRAREQFTVVLLTYNRDAVLATSLERLHRLPYLNKVIVVWNNIAREPMGAWPRLHVPVEFIKVTTNSLNNRFVPWDRITTEAVLSLDDDIDLKQHEIVFAFRLKYKYDGALRRLRGKHSNAGDATKNICDAMRAPTVSYDTTKVWFSEFKNGDFDFGDKRRVWRENRHRIVGFPARHHARYDEQMYYNSNHTCQLSIILTGAAFLHKTPMPMKTVISKLLIMGVA